MLAACHGDDVAARAEAARLRVLVERIDEAIDTLQASTEKLAEQTVHEDQAASRRSRTQMIALLAIAVVVSVGTALYLTRSVVNAVQPIAATMDSLADKCATWLAEGLRGMAKGDLTYKITPVTPPIAGHGKDELGQLADTTNALRDKLVACISAYEAGRTGLQEIVTQVRSAAGSVADISQQLGTATGQTAAAVQ